jgi:hypothetical protein
MSIELTEEQRQALATEPPPCQVIDPQTKETYVLVRSEVFQKMQALLDEDDVRRMEPLLADLSPEDWEDAGNYESKS